MKIYISRERADQLHMCYNNEGVEDIIPTKTLMKYEYDQEHRTFFNEWKKFDLVLEGVGLGWWKVVDMI